jgi:LPXTG-site transpeptidase (sortase) family protein
MKEVGYMNKKKLSLVTLLVWGGAVLLLVGLVVGLFSLAPRIDALFQTADIVPVVTVVVTPTPEVAVPLLPFIEGEPVRSIAAPENTLTPIPTLTYVPYIHPDDANPVATYTLQEEGVIPLRIFIPDIDLEAPIIPIGWIYLEIDGGRQPIWDVPNQRAAGWHETSAKIGAPGNAVLNGHNTSYGEVFRDLYKLEAGATIEIEAEDGLTYTYTVTEKLILREGGQPVEVRLENAQYALPTDDERLTILTCHPYGSLVYRLVIIAHPAAQPSSPSTPIEGD